MIVSGSRLLILVIFFSACNSRSTQSIIEANDILSREELIAIEENSNDFPNNFQVSLGIIDNEITRFAGFLKRNDSLILVDNADMVFEIGSISKVFTSILLCQLILEDSLSLNTVVQDYFDFPLAITDTVTLQNLANHTSGFPRIPSDLFETAKDQNNPYADYNNSHLENYLKEKLILEFKPGVKYQYSNLAVGLLGYILEKESNLTLDDLLQQKIFNPLGMIHSSIRIDKVKPFIVGGLDADGNNTNNWELASLNGAGAIKSSVRDLEKFVRHNFDSDSAYLMAMQPTYSVNDGMDLGLGWHILKDSTHKPWVWHNGGTGGYRSSLGIDLLSKKGVIILSNISTFHGSSTKIDNICFDLLRLSGK